MSEVATEAPPQVPVAQVVPAAPAAPSAPQVVSPVAKVVAAGAKRGVKKGTKRGAVNRKVVPYEIVRLSLDGKALELIPHKETIPAKDGSLLKGFATPQAGKAWAKRTMAKDTTVTPATVFRVIRSVSGFKLRPPKSADALVVEEIE